MKYTLLLLLTVVPITVVTAQGRYSVVISEIMIDPSPVVGLPAFEWIELTNVSASSIDLHNWRINTASAQSGAMPANTLEAFGRLIICSAAASASFAAYGDVLILPSFPSLDNTAGIISIQDNNSNIIHAIGYNNEWYGNALKKEGGWSMEMIDPMQGCIARNNWTASTDPLGGTPGKVNSVNKVITDKESPQLLRAFAPDDTTVILVFNESLDSSTSANRLNFNISNNVQVTSSKLIAPIFQEVEIHSTNLMAQKIYSVTAKGFTDCNGNSTASATTAVGLSEPAQPGDIIINEVLFNPRPTGYDYTELLNRSIRVVDLSRLFIANKNSMNIIGSIVPICKSAYYMYPGDFIVATEDAINLSVNYFVKDPNCVITVATLPSYPDDDGSVVVLNDQGIVVDQLDYSSKWHFPIIQNNEGISLERIDPQQTTQLKTNWHSAASTAGYGTPGYKNSQSFSPVVSNAAFSVTPKCFSPDNDGRDDIATITYDLAAPGFVATVVIYTAGGVAVRTIANNALLSTTGNWTWDGLNDKGEREPMGIYIVAANLFNLEGKTLRFKNAVAIAGRSR